MEMQMMMVGVMFAPTDKITLMCMINYVSKDMNLNTHQAMMSRNLVGSFSASSSDFRNVMMCALISLKKDRKSKWHGEITFQKSFGQKDVKDTMVTPMGQIAEIVLPYAMQPRDGASRLALGLTNLKQITDNLNWGNQVRMKASVAKDDWVFGGEHSFNTWLQYEFYRQWSVSGRFKFNYGNEITGRNLLVLAPIQTADTDNYGGKMLYLGLGVNLIAKFLHEKKVVLALNY
jgi:hypothetical protein